MSRSVHTMRLPLPAWYRRTSDAVGEFMAIGGHSIGRIQKVSACNSSPIARVAIDGVHPVYKHPGERIEAGRLLHWLDDYRMLTGNLKRVRHLEDIVGCAVAWLPADKGDGRVFARLLFGGGARPPAWPSGHKFTQHLQGHTTAVDERQKRVLLSELRRYEKKSRPPSWLARVGSSVRRQMDVFR